MTRDLSRPTRIRSADVFIVVILALQVVAFFPGVGTSLFPFRNYPMYQEAYGQKDVKAKRISVILETRDGEKIEPRWRGPGLLRRKPFGMDKETFYGRYLTDMVGGDERSAHRLAQRVNRYRDDPVTKVHLKIERFVYRDGRLQGSVDKAQSFIVPTKSDQ